MGLIPPFFLDCVVAIGVNDPESEMRCIGSGFLYGHYLRKDEKGENLYRVYLVTNRHVLQDERQVYLRFNPQETDAPARIYPQNLYIEDRPIWWTHPNNQIDVAIVPINTHILKEQAIQFAFFANDQHVADIDKLVDLGIIEGDFIYVLGFPMGLVGRQRNTVIARSGTIARIRDALNRTNSEYLIDAFVFPGNSGGPVVSKPEAMAITGTKSQNAAYLIGIVKSYVPYRDVAVSLQTNRPRVIFEENSGLAAVHPIDFIQETVRRHLKWLESQQES